jgi:hypothetical protein
MSKQLDDSEVFDRAVNILDRALDAAETILRPYTQLVTPENIAAAFVRHCKTHLSQELKNIAEHGHRNDDPADPPPAIPSLRDAAQNALDVLDYLLSDCADDDASSMAPAAKALREALAKA